MKKITVFGATGGTGKQVVEQALASGNEVVAYVRNPSKLGIANDHLSVLQGELADAASRASGRLKKQTSYSRDAKHNISHEKTERAQVNNNVNFKR